VVNSLRLLSQQAALLSQQAALLSQQAAANTVFCADIFKNAFNYLGNLFPRIAVIGDSLSSGQTENPVEGQAGFGDVYGSSWLSVLARNWNCKSRNHYSHAGTDSKEWMNGTNQGEGLKAKMLSDAASNAYFVAMGTNDAFVATSGYDLGNLTDAAGADSFVGYYKSILDTIKGKAPNAVIFCMSCYATAGAAFTNYSNMIKSIVETYYSDCAFYIDFINNTEHTNNERDGVYSIGFHYSTVGYIYVASVINQLVMNVVKNNASFFKIFGVYNSQGGQYEDS
jgi:hypothetical protein